MLSDRPDLHFGVVDGGDGGMECVGSAGGGKAPAAIGAFDTHARKGKPSLYPTFEWETLRPVAPARPTRPTGVRAAFQSQAAAGVPFAAATPAAAGTSMAIAGRGGNDEGAKQDAL